MPLYTDPYTTLVGRVYHNTSTVAAIAAAVIRENTFFTREIPSPNSKVPNLPTSFKAGFITNLSDGEIEVPAFCTPYVINMGQNKNKLFTYPCIIGDLRTCITSPTKLAKELKINDKDHFSFLYTRQSLTAHYAVNSNGGDIRHMPDVLSKIYATWISENLTSRFGLNPVEKIRMSVISSYFYYTLLTGGVDESQKKVIYKKCAGASFCTFSDVERIMDDESIIEMRDLNDLCKNIIYLLDNPRLKDLNAAFLVQALPGMWFGTSNREIAGVALEHIPTFVAMVYYSIQKASAYKRSPFAKLALRYVTSSDVTTIVQRVQSILTGIYH